MLVTDATFSECAARVERSDDKLLSIALGVLSAEEGA